jgi:hypothetical protein
MKFKNVNFFGAFAFRHAYEQLPYNKTGECMDTMMKIFGVSTRQAVYRRMKGFPEPKVTQAVAIEAYFRCYKIEVKWGEPIFEAAQ